MTNLTEGYLDGLEGVASAAFSSEVVNQATMCVVDYLACSYLGQRLIERESASLVEAAGQGLGNSHLVGMGARTAAQTAALVNGMSAHAAEFDDGHRFGMVHVGAPVISALLAVAGSVPMSGEQFLRGVVLGYEALVRLAAAMQPGHKLKGYHTTGTCGTVGAAMGIAFALGFTREQVKATLSAAATGAAGLLEVQENSSTLKPYNAGRAAAEAVNAALVGRAGFVGPDDVLGGRRGFLQAVANDVDERVLTGGFGGNYAIQTIYRKPYASCRHSHAAIEAALLAARGNHVRPEDVVAVEVETYNLAVGGHDHVAIEGPSSAKMSIPYSVAAALVFGKVDYQQFEEACLDDEHVRALTEKVSVVESSELSALVPAKRAAIAIVRTCDAEFSARVDYPKGEPENPISAEELEGKFFSLLAAAGQDETYACELLECAWHIEERFPDLLEMLR